MLKAKWKAIKKRDTNISTVQIYIWGTKHHFHLIVIFWGGLPSFVVLNENSINRKMTKALVFLKFILKYTPSTNRSQMS